MSKSNDGDSRDGWGYALALVVALLGVFIWLLIKANTRRGRRRR